MNRDLRASALRPWLAFLTCAIVLSFAVQRAEVLRAATLHERVLYAFRGGTDGKYPYGSLLADSRGALYGTTINGGTTACGYANGCGTIFKLIRSKAGYVERVIHRFGFVNDGSLPDAGLIVDSRGVLYGTTGRGGTGPCEGPANGCGTVFKLTPTRSGYSETRLYDFRGGADGMIPTSTLVMDENGSLFGTTIGGGSATGCIAYAGYCGVVFELTPSGSGYRETVLHRFQGGSDGADPSAGVVLGAGGALYGTTVEGGSGTDCGSLGCGTVFELKPTARGYTERVIHTFGSMSGGQYPSAPLFVDAAGALYGTTRSGGGENCARIYDNACGVVFKLTPKESGYAFAVVHRFSNGERDGGRPFAALLQEEDGVLYGTTFTGGGGSCPAFGSSEGCGTAYELAPAGSGYAESLLYRFQLADGGDYPAANLIADRHGVLYGTATHGGDMRRCQQTGLGVVFALTP